MAQQTKSNNKQNRRNGKNAGKPQYTKKNGEYRGKQGKKDSSSKRVNYDNAREDKVAKQIEEDSKRQGANDFAWANKNPELLKSAASIPVASIVGQPLFMDQEDSLCVPGVMSIQYSPAFGNGNGQSQKPTALNMAADQTYSITVHANSRDYAYTAPDLAVVTFGGIQAYAMLGSMMRAYGTTKLYREQSVYMPEALLSAQGFDPTDVRNNLGQMWFDINNFVEQLRQIWIPNIYPIMERWFWLNTNVFKDADGPRAQMYIFVQSQYLYFTETGYKTGSGLVGLTEAAFGGSPGSAFAPGAGKTYTWDQWKQAMQFMLDSLINSEDRGIMYGDLLNCYGATNMYTIGPIDASYAIEPTYNAEVLAEIENLIVTPRVISGLYQSEEDLYYLWDPNSVLKTAGSTTSNGAPSKTVLNFHTADQPSIELITAVTRMQVMREVYSNKVQTINPASIVANDGQEPSTGLGFVPTIFGSELCNAVVIWYKDRSGALLSAKTGTSIGGAVFSAAFGRMMAFDWHPFFYNVNSYISGVTTPTVNTVYNLPYEAWGDYDNYTVYTPEELDKIHQAVMYSYFGVPQR